MMGFYTTGKTKGVHDARKVPFPSFNAMVVKVCLDTDAVPRAAKRTSTRTIYTPCSQMAAAAQPLPCNSSQQFYFYF